MYQIRHFKPTLFLLLLLGMGGFALAAQSPVALFLGCGGVLVNAAVVFTGKFKPMPRLLANVVTICSLIVVARQLVNLRYGGSDASNNPVIIIGHFLVVLQLVKLWEQRLNRDYAQLLILSLLLMVAAAINTNLFAFGLLLITYLCLSLYCCLLLHLKAETDRVRLAVMAPPDEEPAPPPPDEQRSLARSTRRMAAVVAAYAVVVATITFIFFPRGTGNGLLTPAQLTRTLATTGYNDRLSLDPYNTSLEADEQIIAHARVSQNGRELGPGSTIYFRGLALNWYQSFRSRGEFQRIAEDSKPINIPRETEISLRRGRRTGTDEMMDPTPLDEGGSGTTWTQSLTLSPTGTRVLFFVSGNAASGQRAAAPLGINSRRETRLTVGADGSVQTEETLSSPIEYEGTSDDRVPTSIGEFGGRPELATDLLVPAQVTELSVAPPALPQIQPGTFALRVDSPRRHMGLQRDDLVVAIDGKLLSTFPADQRATLVSQEHQKGRSLTVVRDGRTTLVPNIPPEVVAYALRPEVSGSDEQGSLAARRDRSKLTDPLDEKIARSIERHLRTQFAYTMDISDARTRADMDPIVWFLSEDGRRGHCEYFAAAMTLMCQSLGIQTRVVSGYRCDEYNDFSHQFVVRQSHAHAWVEVLSADGWRTYDPTSGRDAGNARVELTLWQRVKHLFDWMESSYTNHVIYYNADSRENLIQSLEVQMTKPLYSAVNQGWITSRFKDSKLAKLLANPFSGPIGWILSGVVLVVALWLGRYVRRWWRLRSRAERIGIDMLPAAERLRLARQLGFYDDLLRLLEKRKITRQEHQTPLEFARSLLFLPADAYEVILRMTSIFYRVRYGQQSLSSGLQKRLHTVIHRLDGELTTT